MLPTPRKTPRIKLPVQRILMLQIVILAVTIAAAVLVVQLWFGLLPAEVSVKILITCLIVAGVSGAIYAIADDITAERVQRRDNHLN